MAAGLTEERTALWYDRTDNDSDRIGSNLSLLLRSN
jgi:hypothetical protein